MLLCYCKLSIETARYRNGILTVYFVHVCVVVLFRSQRNIVNSYVSPALFPQPVVFTTVTLDAWNPHATSFLTENSAVSQSALAVNA